ncbi:hypothetical protein PF002_g24316 [Phytophthora fragariae]|uniref:Uncharacterized protein n=1 Tax=Phytophthora fragariae TaxID=53985 RepID=A0A6A3WVU2_9STRA|nr:hypothetical protein PF002_g24316 [Phytophthora fragariae]KAE9271051.1 hypothetical protein PF008_g30450 [Phytophthora fragariae]
MKRELDTSEDEETNDGCGSPTACAPKHIRVTGTETVLAHGIECTNARAPRAPSLGALQTGPSSKRIAKTTHPVEAIVTNVQRKKEACMALVQRFFYNASNTFL